LVAALRLNVWPGSTTLPLTASAARRMLTPESAANPPVLNELISSGGNVALICSVVTFGGETV
jgi:hypothetical protein